MEGKELKGRIGRVEENGRGGREEKGWKGRGGIIIESAIVEKGGKGGR